MSVNKGIIIAAPGQAEIRDAPYPEIRGNDWVIIKPAAIAINPTDPYHVDLDDSTSCEGCLVGCDFAGRIVEVALGATHGLREGDRVFGCSNGSNKLDKRDGSFAHYIAAKSGVVFKTPDNITDEEAATQGVAIVTTGQGLYDYLGLPFPPAQVDQPTKIFIYGGSTAMGVSGIQFAKASGLTVIATASPSNFDYVKSLGADHVFDYSSPTIIEDVRRLAPEGLQLAWDCRPCDESAVICAALLSTEGGAKFNTLVPFTDPLVKKLNPAVETSTTLAYSAFGEPWFFGERNPASSVDYDLAKRVGEVGREWLKEGKVKPPTVYLNRGGSGLEGALHGIDELRKGNVRGGKLVYTM